MKKMIAITMLALAATSHAQSYRSVYDAQSGNSYTIRQSGTETHVNGYNINTGSIWNETHRQDGSYSGMDSKGNVYSGDNRTGFYQNYGTGRMCFGQGAARVCN